MCFCISWSSLNASSLNPGGQPPCCLSLSSETTSENVGSVLKRSRGFPDGNRNLNRSQRGDDSRLLLTPSLLMRWPVRNQSPSNCESQNHAGLLSFLLSVLSAYFSCWLEEGWYSATSAASVLHITVTLKCLDVLAFLNGVHFLRMEGKSKYVFPFFITVFCVCLNTD